LPADSAGNLDISDNQEINDLMRMMAAARDELISSASARLPSGLETFDLNRWSAVIQKIQTFSDSYIATLTPIDTPQNSGTPLTEPATGVGQQTR